MQATTATAQSYKSSKRLRKSKMQSRWVQPHPLHGFMKKIVIAKIPAEGGYFLKKMKLKTAIQKGYYKVNTTDPKVKEKIEAALASIKNAEAAKLNA